MLNAQGGGEIFLHNILLKSKTLSFAGGPFARYDKYWIFYDNVGAHPKQGLGPFDDFGSYSYGVRCSSLLKIVEDKGVRLINLNSHLGYSDLFKNWYVLVGLNLTFH
jgi:hypothetical protein